MITKANIIAIAPEFTNVPQGVFDIVIPMAQAYVAEAVWVAKADQGVTWMSCHILKTLGYGDDEAGQNAGPNTGAVTQEKVGDLQRSYSALQLKGTSDFDTVLSLTRYGQMFIMLRKTIATSPLVI